MGVGWQLKMVEKMQKESELLYTMQPSANTDMNLSKLD